MVFFYYSLNCSQFVCAEPGISRERDWNQPKLRALIVTIDVDVWRLAGLVAEEIECIRPNPEDCRHGIQGRDFTSQQQAFLDQADPQPGQRGHDTKWTQQNIKTA